MNRKTVKIVRSDICKFAVLQSEGSYLIDGKLITSKFLENKKVLIENEKDVRIVEFTKVIDSYLYDNKEITIGEYENKIKFLTSNDRTEFFDEEFDEYKFKNIEYELEYLNFTKRCNAIYKTIQKVSDPIICEYEETIFNPNEKHIINIFSNASKEFSLFEYDEYNHRVEYLHKWFYERGFKLDEYIEYEKTRNNKIYCIREKNDIDSLKAFGTFPFARMNFRKKYSGTYDECKKQYNSTIEMINETLEKLYKEKFSEIDLNKLDNEILDYIKYAYDNLMKVKPSKQTIYDYNSTLNYIRRIQKMLYKSMEGSNKIM